MKPFCPVIVATLLLLPLGCKAKAAPPAPEPETPSGVSGSSTAQPAAASRKVYWNQVAGQFYPADPVELANSVAGYLKDAGSPPADVAGRDLLGFVSPHAGYPYSGPVAGHAYRLLDGRRIGTVVILALAHRGGSGKRSAILPYDSYRTPLGEVPIDTELVADILERGKGGIDASEAPFAGEHSLEVQLPFIQKSVPDARIVPIMVGHLGGQLDEGLASAIHGAIGDRSDVVVVASTDLSHYEPYDTAIAKDGKTLDLIAALDWGSLEAEGIQSGRMCGFFGVGVLMRLAKLFGEGLATGSRVEYRNSGDTAGSRDGGVVGYGVVAFTLPSGTRSGAKAQAGSPAPVAAAPEAAAASGLSPEDSEELRIIALDAARAAASGKAVGTDAPSGKALQAPSGAFVIVRVGGVIRGMGGSLDASGPLYAAARAAAAKAAGDDPRYPDVGGDEIASLAVEVFVVASSWPLADTSAWDPATQGLFVQAGGLEGFLGPGEATGPSAAEDGLDQACRRVGLVPGCWRGGKHDVVPVFTAFSGGSP